MGNPSRHRRAEQRRRRRGAVAPKAPKPSNQLSVREVIHAAAAASRQPLGGGGRYRDLLRWLAGDPPGVGRELHVALEGALRQVRSRHWEPSEVDRLAERRLGARHGACLRAVVAGSFDVERWAGDEGLSSLDGIACAVEVLALLLSLPALPELGGRPTPRSPQEPRMLEKVRALLAKAESTTFPEEAEALSGKAQELMARYSIDMAMLGSEASVLDGPTGMRVPVDDPYASPKSILLSEVASANRCRAVWSKGLGFSTVMGFESDLMFVEVLYTSLLVQATSAMVASGPQVDRSGRSRTRSFRQAFLLAYATRIGRRLRDAEAAGRAAAAEEHGEALLPVLADRTAAVESALAAAFPSMVSRSVSVSNAAGWAAGAAAADMASLSGRTQVPSRPG
jgi:hypothetical protein